MSNRVDRVNLRASKINLISKISKGSIESKKIGISLDKLYTNYKNKKRVKF